MNRPHPLAIVLTPPEPGSPEAALVVDLAATGPGALAAVGGKAANLGVLIRAGLPVPPGVCITTEAYRRLSAHARLDGLLDALAATPPTDLAHLAALAGRIRAALLEAPVPPSVARAVAAAHARLGTGSPVAVRSSATAEDLPHASFAGQQDTFLHVVGPEAVLGAVRRCWASLWTDRAVVYRATNGIDHRGVRLAVVVQRMVDAVTAGVLFTANPVTGRRREAVVDASPGLGEAVVSGAVDPDHFVVDTASGEIRERRIGAKRVMVRARTGGGTEQVERRFGGAACLADAQLRVLAGLGDRVEALFGAPQDVEWAFDSAGKAWLTQARPVTTLFPLPATAPPPGADPRVYFCFGVAQGVYRPFTPMGLACFRVLASAASGLLGFPVADPRTGPGGYAEAGQRVFLDVTAVLRSRAGRALMPLFLDVMEARSAMVLRRLSGDPRLGPTCRGWWSGARAALRVAARFRVPVTALRALLRPAEANRAADRVGRALADRWTASRPATAAQRLDRVEEVLLEGCIPLAPRILPGALVGFAMLALARRLLGGGVERDELQAVVRGLEHNVTTEMDLALWALYRRIAGDGEAFRVLRDHSVEELAERFGRGGLPPVAQRGLAEFLGRYGHRAVAEIDVGMPRWSDDPRHVLGVLRNFLGLGGRAAAPDAVFARRAAEAEAMIGILSARARRRGRLRAALVRFALGRARGLLGLREAPKFHLVAALAAARRELRIVGEELASRGCIERADDVFFVDLAEARAGLGGCDLRDAVARRRAEYQRELRRRQVPRVLLSDGSVPEAQVEPAPAPDGALAGTPASAGRVTGVARVIFDPVGAQVTPGEILVVPSTDPGWTPLFLVAGGLVMEMGGSNSHGAVVAREYGIPAVVGVPNATARIRTGQRIEIDGSAGRVEVVASAA